MNKIVFFGWKARSNFNETISILEKLAKKNVKVYYFGFKEYRQDIEKLNIEFFEYMDIESMLKELFENIELKYTVDDVITRSNIFNRKLIRVFKKMAEYDYEKVEKISPDIIFRDNDAVNGKIIADKLQKQTVGINCLISILNDDVRSNPVELYGLYNSVNLKNIKSIKESDFYSEIIDGHMKNSRELGVPYINPVHSLDGEDDINISFGGNLIQPERVIDKRKYIIVKPLFRNMYLEKESDEEIESFIKEGKLIYLSTGSMIRGSNKFYNTVINVIRKTEYKLIISVPNLSGNYTKTLPKNVLVRRMVDQQKILGKADLFITAGGYNSICEAIDNLVPMLVKPIINDQAYNAYKIKQLEIGEAIESEDVSKDFLLEYIELLMSDKKYKDNLRKIRDNVNSSEDMQTVLDSIVDNI